MFPDILRFFILRVVILSLCSYTICFENKGYFIYPEVFFVVKLLTLLKSIISVSSLNSGSLDIAMNNGLFDFFLSSSMLNSKRSIYSSTLWPNSKCCQSLDYLNSLSVCFSIQTSFMSPGSEIYALSFLFVLLKSFNRSFASIFISKL